ncbi:PDZ domain-containing protein, partial [Candidatus Bipolaricaulota bacterium]
MQHRRIWCAFILSILLFLPACAQLGDSASTAPLADYYNASSPEALEDAISQLVQSGIDVVELARMLREGKEYSDDVPIGWAVYYYDGPDDRTRPFHVYVPTDYDSSQSYTVLFDLHGAVSSQPQPAEYLELRRRLWSPEAEEFGWILIVPHGDRLASWFSSDGHANILGELEFVKREYNVDENKVFVSGFSDGGSGAFWQGFHDPTPWAAMLSFHGHPGVGGYGPYQSYPRNLLNRPIRATNGQYDDLYPPSGISPFVDLFLELGVELDWIVYPGGHEMDFLNTEAALTIDYITNTERNPFPSEVVWETSSTEVGRCDWVCIDEIADVGNNEDFHDINLAEVPERIVFGASLAYHGGTLFTVAGLEPASAAHSIGIKNGDQILRIDSLTITTQTDIGNAMVGKAPGDPVEVEIVRSGETMMLTGHIPLPDPIYRRDVLAGSIRATAVGNEIEVSVSHVGRYSLFISSQQFDLAQPILVTTNGQSSFSGEITPDVRFMLERAADDLDRELVYEAK